MKRVAVIAWDTESVKLYAKQVNEFFGDSAEVVSYNSKDGSADQIEKSDLYIVSTCAFDGENVNEYLPVGGEVVIIQVTVTKQALYRLLDLPRGTRALMVNINQRMVTETMAFLNHVGVNHIEFVPYWPGMVPPLDIEIAVTPGESRYVPGSVRQIVDIGSRLLSVETFVEMAYKLKVEELLQQKTFLDYLQTIVDPSRTLCRMFHRSIQMESMFDLLQGVLDVGVVGVDIEGAVFAFNHQAQYVTGVSKETVMDQLASEVLPYLPFDECLSNGIEVGSRLINVDGVDINVSITPIVGKGGLIGAFAIIQRFTDEEFKQHKLRRQLVRQGHSTKYTFDTIVGKSQAIRTVKDIAQEMADSNASVLITGESGTGKELFAQAIHAASPRSEYPFVAINCAAIPDSLLESELFGYVEGAFTGAKKGGKLGYFEIAHKGTLFLDEIEGMSQLLQVKLLRAIQEREVLRVGGQRVISVDVRIIAASNENILELVRSGKFRKDLYYRLAVLPIDLPPLREREEDTLLLMEEIKRQLNASFSLTERAKQALLTHTWEGNIRELRNCAEYLACVKKDIIDLEDLPKTISMDMLKPAVQAQKGELSAALRQVAGNHLPAYRFVLDRLYHANQLGIPTGRKAISDEATASGLPLTEQEVRTILGYLERLGLVEVRRGRGGSHITKLGEQLAQLDE